MNGYERISAVLNGNWPDKRPVMLHNFMMAARESGISMAQFRSDPKLMAEAFIHSVEKYNLDGIMIDVDTVTIAGAIGVPVEFPEHEPARTACGFLDSLNKTGNLPPVNIENYRPVHIWLEAVRKIKEYFGNEVYVRGNCDQAPFSLASMVRGMQNWMTDLLVSDDRSLLHDLLQYCTGPALQFIRLMAQTGCDMVSNGDSPAGPDLVPPEIFQEFALPYEKILADEAHRLGLPYTMHICGDTGLILELLTQTGSDAFELDYKTDMVKARDAFSGKYTLIGNIDPSGVLALGTPQLVEMKTRELLDVFRNEPRLIVNAGCAIPPGTPSENIRKLVETVHRSEL